MVELDTVRYATVVTELLCWLRETDWNAAAARVRSWDEATWQQVPRALYLHTLVPWVVPILEQQPALAAALPDGLRTHLAQLHAWGVERSRLQRAELQAILEVTADAQVPLLPLKGAVTAHQLYPTPDFRQMADLDLLVQPDAWPAVSACMARLGYVEKERNWKNRTYTKPGWAQHVPWTWHPDNARLVDVGVHAAEGMEWLAADFTAALWTRAVPGELLGVPCRLPDPVTHFIFTTVHAAAHIIQGPPRLVWLQDTAFFARYVGDRRLWPEAQAWLDRLDARLTAPALAMAEAIFPGSVPAAALAGLQSRLPPVLHAWLATQLDPVPLTDFMHWRSVRERLRWTATSREWLRLVWYEGFPHRWRLADHYPSLAASRWWFLAYGPYAVASLRELAHLARTRFQPSHGKIANDPRH